MKMLCIKFLSFTTAYVLRDKNGLDRRLEDLGPSWRVLISEAVR